MTGFVLMWFNGLSVSVAAQPELLAVRPFRFAAAGDSFFFSSPNLGGHVASHVIIYMYMQSTVHLTYDYAKLRNASPFVSKKGRNLSSLITLTQC